MYTVKQLSDLAGVTVRTLHHYDQIGLLRPSKVGANSYRYYDDDALLRLQQILFYREIGLELTQIRDILDSPDFDLLTALRSHRAALHEKIVRLQNLMNTVDSTIMHVGGEITMTRKRMFEAFSEKKQKEYERRARLQYGPDNVNESVRRWNSYTDTQRQAIFAEGNALYTGFVDLIEAGKAAQGAEAQALAVRWHEHIRYFYEPTLEILRGLGDLYTSDSDFRANFGRLHPDLAGYLQTVIAQYVDDLETAEIERMLAEDQRAAGS